MKDYQQTWDDMQQIQQMLDNVNYVDRSFTGNFMTGLKQGGSSMIGSVGGLARMAGATGIGDYLTNFDDQYQASVPQTGYDPQNAQQVLGDAINPSSPLWSSGEGARLVGQGIASVLSFAVPQAAGARAAIAGANALGKIGQVKKFTDFIAGSKVAQNVLGSTFPAVNEAMTEGGTEYNDVYRKTGDDNQASVAAAQTIGDNMGLLLGTNAAEMALAFATPGGKVFQAATKGLTGKLATAGAKVAGVGAMEGYQEVMQQRIQDAASDGTGGIFSGDVSWTPAPQTVDEAMSGVAGAITGGAIGGAGHLLSGNKKPAPAVTDQEQQDAGATVPGAIDPNTVPPVAPAADVAPAVSDDATTRTPVDDAHAMAMQNIIQNYNDPNVDTSAISSDDARLIDEFPNMSHETQAAAIPGLVERNQQFALYNPAPAPTITTPQVDPALQQSFDDTINRLSDPNSNIQLTSSEQNMLSRLPSMPYEQKVNAMNAMVRKYATPVAEAQAVPQEQQQPQQETQKAFTRPELKTAHDNLVANINDPAVDTSMVNQHDLNSLKNMGRMPQQTRAKEMARIAAAYPTLIQREAATQPQSPVATTSNDAGTNTSAAPNSSVTGQINEQIIQQVPQNQRRNLEDIINSRPEVVPQESPVNNVKSQRLEQRLAGKVSPTKADTTIAEVVSEAAGGNNLAAEIAASEDSDRAEGRIQNKSSKKESLAQKFKKVKKDNTLKSYVPEDEDDLEDLLNSFSFETVQLLGRDTSNSKEVPISDSIVDLPDGVFYHGTKQEYLSSMIQKNGDLILNPSKNFGGRTTSISFTPDRKTARNYGARDNEFNLYNSLDAAIIAIDPDALPLHRLHYESEEEIATRNDKEPIVIPKGSYTIDRSNLDKLEKWAKETKKEIAGYDNATLIFKTSEATERANTDELSFIAMSEFSELHQDQICKYGYPPELKFLGEEYERRVLKLKTQKEIDDFAQAIVDNTVGFDAHFMGAFL